MMALTSEPCEIDSRDKKRRPAVDLRRRSGQEVQDQKDELTAWADERVQKVGSGSKLSEGRPTIRRSPFDLVRFV
jgi:hypothetical protein